MNGLKRDGKYPSYPEKVIQFGEGNFLRAFADYMIDMANEKGVFGGSVIVVKPIEYGTLDKFRAQDCLYTLSHRGILNGETVEDYRVISSISRVIDSYGEFDKLMECAEIPTLRFVISNTTEAGIVYDPTDRFENRPAVSYPGKLTQFLFARYRHFQGSKDKGMVMIPCELIEDNGKNLKKCVLQQIANWGLEDGFRQWVEEACIFTSTLVDRIVTGYPKDAAADIFEKLGYEDPLLDTCEPFDFWVIESEKDISKEFPMDQAGMHVVFTDNMKPYRERKVRILNGAHTSMVLAAYLAGKDFVLECMEDEEITAYMNKCLFDEIIPTLTLPKEELDSFAASVVERFRNPYIKHALLSISLNSFSKWKARVLPSFTAYAEKRGTLPRFLTFSFAALLCFYQGTEIRDNALIGHRGDGEYQILDDMPVLEFCRQNTEQYKSNQIDTEAYARSALSRTDFWGQDLSQISGFVQAVAEDIRLVEGLGMKKAVSSLLGNA